MTVLYGKRDEVGTYKTFNGKRYYFFGTRADKADAQLEANRLEESNFIVKLVPIKMTYGTWWGIYARGRNS